MRVISLVPSLTLTLAELGLDSSQLVGRTPWCIHPADYIKDVQVIGGTKTPNLNKIRNAKPDLVLLDREENPKKVFDELTRLGINTHVSYVEGPSDVPNLLLELGQLLGLETNARKLAKAVEEEIAICQQGIGPVVLPLSLIHI